MSLNRFARSFRRKRKIRQNTKSYQTDGYILPWFKRKCGSFRFRARNDNRLPVCCKRQTACRFVPIVLGLKRRCGRLNSNASSWSCVIKIEGTLICLSSARNSRRNRVRPFYRRTLKLVPITFKSPGRE